MKSLNQFYADNQGQFDCLGASPLTEEVFNMEFANSERFGKATGALIHVISYITAGARALLGKYQRIAGY